MKKFTLIAVISSLLLSACNSTSTEPVETGDEANESAEQIAKEKAESTEAKKTPTTQETSTTTELTETQSPQYIPYSADIYKEILGKKPLALFFHATWCSTCKKMNKNITDALSTFPNNTIILKVDYDSETELKKTYGITSQSTIVIVDKNGKALKTLVAPDNEELIEEISATL